MAKNKDLTNAAAIALAAAAPLLGAVAPKEAGPMNFPVKRHRPKTGPDKIAANAPSHHTPPKHEPSQAKLKARKKKNAAKRRHR